MPKEEAMGEEEDMVGKDVVYPSLWDSGRVFESMALHVMMEGTRGWR